MNKRRLEDYLYCLLIGGVYLYAVNLSVLTSTVIYVPASRLFFTGLAALCVYMVIFFNRYTLRAAGIFLLLAAGYVYFTWESRQPQLAFINELFMLARGYIAYREEYAQTLLILICAGTALPMALFLYVRFNFYALVLGGASTFVLNWVMNYHRDDSAFILFIFCFCMLLIKKLTCSTNRESRSGLAALLALPVCALAVFVAGRVPGQEATYTGQSIAQLLDTPIAVVNEFVYLAFNPKYFSFQTTGFTGTNDRLGGPVAVNTREVMTVDAPGRVYLSGAVKNTYTGSTWSDTITDGDLPHSGFDAGRLEFLETAASLMRYTSFYKPYGSRAPTDIANIINMFPNNDQPRLKAGMFSYLDISGIFYTFLPTDTLRVTVGKNRSGTVFRPQKAMPPAFDEQSLLYEQELTASAAGDLQTDRLMAQGASYGYQYLNIDRRLEVVSSMLNITKRGFYSAIEQKNATGTYEPDFASALTIFDKMYRAYTKGNEESTDKSGLLFQYTYNQQMYIDTLNAFERAVLIPYAESIYRHYTALPKTLPRRVYDLADDLTKDCETDYEKVKALETYVQSFPYTLTPTAVPEDTDFVDYFLFEGREGYCTYYASAMAVLSRCAGIPSRYVEGYLMPTAPGAEGLYVVTNKQAHSWAEVYLEGYGWLALEATAPYNYVAETRPNTSAAGMFTPSFMDSPQYEEHLRDIGFDDRMLKQPDIIPPTAAVEAVVQVSKAPTIWGMVRLLLYCIAVGLLFLSFFGIQGLREALRLRRVSRLTVNEQAQVYFNGILTMTTYYHYPIRGNETPRAYGTRLGKRFAFKSDTVFLRDLISLYYKAKYSDKPLNDYELTLLRDSYFDMVAFIRSVRRLPHFIYLRYIRRVTLL